MNELLIGYFWKHRLAGGEFRNEDGMKVKVEHPGVANMHAGPDFLNARIRIGDTLWAGNVEIHWRASDWIRHKHQDDEKYANVILHVVMVNDQTVFSTAGRKIPCLNFSDYVPDTVLATYERLMTVKSEIPCHAFLGQLKWPPLLPWLGRLALERLERKAHILIRDLAEFNNQWYDLGVMSLFKTFGIPANSMSFERLGRKYLEIKSNHSLDREDTEAVLFFLSGMIPADIKDVCLIEWRKKGAELAGIENSLLSSDWSFLRMRPQSFPSIRLALLAAMLPRIPSNIEEALDTQNAAELMDLFNVRASSYWETHFSPGSESTRTYPKVIGGQFATTLTANWLSPLLAARGIYTGEHRLVRKAFTALETAQAEDNHITRKWQNLNLQRITGTESQGLMELFQSYCSAKKCLECRIGFVILNGRHS